MTMLGDATKTAGEARGRPPECRPLGPGERLYFLHIPKTAGTSLRTFLESRFAVGEVCPHLTLPALLPVAPSELERYRLFCGHHGLYIRHLLREEPVTVTVLRDPLERTVSHYRHLVGTPSDWLHERVKGMSFEEFVTSDLGVSELLNFQCRYLAFEDIQADYFEHSKLREKRLDVLETKYADPTLLDRALATLDRIACVGIQERFEETLRLISYTLGWPPVTAFPKYNVSEAKFGAGDLTPRALERVRELTRLDQALYKHAARVFERALASITPEAAERAYERAMAERTRVRTLSMGFDKPIFGDNWLERQSPNGQWARWTGPGRVSTMDLPLANDESLVLRFCCGTHTMDVIESLRVFANDVPLTMRWWQLHDPARPQRTFEAVLRPEVLRARRGYTRLRFEVDKVSAFPTDSGAKTNNPPRGLYFFWLEVFSG